MNLALQKSAEDLNLLEQPEVPLAPQAELLEVENVKGDQANWRIRLSRAFWHLFFAARLVRVVEPGRVEEFEGRPVLDPFRGRLW